MTAGLETKNRMQHLDKKEESLAKEVYERINRTPRKEYVRLEDL